MMQCEIAYQQGDKQALMVALEICLGVWLPAGRPLPEWIGREFNAAIQTIPKSWDDVFGKPLRSNSGGHTAFSVMQEHHASKGDMVATIANKIGRSYGTARALYYDDDYLQILTRGKALAKEYGLRIQNPVWNEYLIYALGLGYLVPVLEAGSLRYSLLSGRRLRHRRKALTRTVSKKPAQFLERLPEKPILDGLPPEPDQTNRWHKCPF